MNCPLCQRLPIRFWSWSLEIGAEIRCDSCSAPLRRRNGRVFRIANITLAVLFGVFHRFLPIPGELGFVAVILFMSVTLALIRRRFEEYEVIPPDRQSSV